MVESQLISDPNPYIPKPLELEKSIQFFNKLKITKCKHCNTSFSKTDPIFHYEHSSGWIVPGYEKKQWLFIKCENCGDEISLWKLGVGKELLPIERTIRLEDFKAVCMEKIQLQSNLSTIKIKIGKRLMELTKHDPYWEVDSIPEEMAKRQSEIDNLNSILNIIIKSD